MAAALERHGSLEIVVNNAGFLWDGVLHKMDDAQWNAVLACHLTAPFQLARAEIDRLRAEALPGPLLVQSDCGGESEATDSAAETAAAPQTC